MGATEELVLAALALTTMIVAQLTSHLNALYMNLCTTSRNSPAREALSPPTPLPVPAGAGRAVLWGSQPRIRVVFRPCAQASARESTEVQATPKPTMEHDRLQRLERRVSVFEPEADRLRRTGRHPSIANSAALEEGA